jgi:cyclopropane fatty-acyl-phospholipid synthase-like methyltransferase
MSVNLEKPYALSCDRNRDPILEIIRQYLAEPATVLEIASGTGQHGLHFTKAMPHLSWQCSDLPANLPGIQIWLDEAGLSNTPAAVALDVNQIQWPLENMDVIFTANSLHIMSWDSVKELFERAKTLLQLNGQLIVYGPFNYNGEYSSESNQQFDQWLLNRDPQSAIRHFEDVCQLAEQAGLSLIQDHPMPANNRCIVWKKTA